MAKAKSSVKKEVEKIEESVLDVTDCKCGEEINTIEDFKEMQEYFQTAKDLVVVHDDEIEDIQNSLKDLHSKVDRALSRLGIS